VLIAKAPAIGCSTSVADGVPNASGDKYLFANAGMEGLSLEGQLNLALDKRDQFIRFMDKIGLDLPGWIRPHRVTKSPLSPDLL
jgi:hypothetical protein